MKKRFQLLIVILFFAASFLSFSIHAFSSTSEGNLLMQAVPDNCVECHLKNKDEVMGLFAQSQHARRKLSCDACHGGKTAATEKAQAHSGNFIGKPIAGQTLERCGTCHQRQLAAFKSGKHIQEDGKTPRVDCVQCHGAHLVGSLAIESNFALLCSNCHGLEYLPELPVALRNILSVNDEVKNALGKLQNAGGKPPESAFSQRRELRRTIAEIVHSTNANQAKAHEQQILEMSKALKLQIQNLKN